MSYANIREWCIPCQKCYSISTIPEGCPCTKHGIRCARYEAQSKDTTNWMKELGSGIVMVLIVLSIITSWVMLSNL